MLASLNKIKVTDPIDLLQPKQIISFPIGEFAAALYPRIKDFIVDDARGLYVPYRSRPIVSPNQILKKKDGTLLSWNDLATWEEDVYNDKGQIVITGDMLKLKGTAIYSSPDVSNVVLKLIRHYVEYMVTQNCAWASTSHTRALIARLVADSDKVDYINTAMPVDEDGQELTALEYIERELEKVCAPLVNIVDNFTSNTAEDNWAIYFTKLVDNNIFLIKSIDWRVYKWTNDEYDKQNPDIFE